MKSFDKSSIALALAISCTLGLVGPLSALAASPAAVDLGSAGNFEILAKTGISTTGSTSVVGDIGVSPAQATYITGFALSLPAGGAFSTSALVTGKVYAPGYADPTPATLTTAVLDMQNAYTDAAGRAPSATELGAGNIGGMTLAPGVYKWSSGVTIPTDVTLSGGANDVWIFQIAQNLSVSSGVHIVLSGGAQAANVFWQVAGQTTIGTTAVMNGNILDQTSIVLNTGAQLTGRALAQAAVTLDANTVTLPTLTAQASAIPAVPATPATPAVPTVSPAVSATPATPAVSASTQSQSLTAQQQALYNQFIAAGASQSAALNAASQVSAQTTSTAIPAPASVFGREVRSIVTVLTHGSRGDSVSVLQGFLISQNKGPAAQALGKIGVTAYFGALTRAALAEFQASVGISPALGNFGPITRDYMSSHY